MKIEIKDEEDLLVLTTEDLNNLNYVELEISEDGKFVSDIMVPIDELKAAVDAFMQLRKDNDERDRLYEK
jgi:hypothetical protein